MMLAIKTRSAVGLFLILCFCCAFISCKRTRRKNGSTNDKTQNAVGNLQHEWLTKTTIKFTWDPPPSGTSSIIYNVKQVRENKQIRMSTKDTSCTFENLEPCGQFKFFFYATDTAAKVKFTPVDQNINSSIEAPTKPENVRFIEKQNTVVWSNSKVNNLCRTGILLQILADENILEEVILPRTIEGYKLRELNLLQKKSVITITVQSMGFGTLASPIVSRMVAGKVTDERFVKWWQLDGGCVCCEVVSCELFLMLSTVLFGLLVASLTGLIVVTWLWQTSLPEPEKLISNKNAVENVKHIWKAESNSLELHWDPPQTTTTVDHYTLVIHRENTKLQSHETTDTEFTFRNLEPCANYKVTFNAFDRDQITKYKIINYSPDVLLEAPGSPANFSINSYTFVATWSHVIHNQFCLANYHLRIFHGDICIKDIVLPKEVSKYKLLDINSCSLYTAVIEASGVENLSSQPQTANFGISSDVRRDRPYIEKLTYEVFPQGSVRLQWEAPMIINCVYDFVVSYFDSKGLQMKETNITSINITDLDPCVPHRIVVMPRTSFKELIGRSKEMVVRTKAFVPGPVRNLYATNDDSGNVLLYWLPPIENVACVETYMVRVFKNSGSTRDYLTKTLYFNVTARQMCVHHLFQVISLNADNKESAPREIDYFFVPEDRLIDNVNFEEIDNGLSVSWKTSAYERECFELFKVDVCALDHDAPCRTSHAKERADDRLSTFIDTVMPCVTYKISIFAVETEKQYAFFSEVYRINPKIYQKPLFREILEVTAHAVSIHWIVNDFDKNRCQLQFVQLECLTDDNALVSTLLNATQSSNIMTRLENLTPFTRYTCTLALINVAGKSEKSSEVVFQTQEDVPSQPIDISTVRVTSDSIKLSWQPPVHTNGVLKGYKVEFTNSRLKYPLPSWCYYPGEINRSITLPANIQEYTAQKLSPFSEYTVTVYAGTKIGFGMASRITVITLANYSTAVTQPQYINVAPLSYTITWKQPCRPNGILKTFKVTVVGKRKNHNDDVFSCLVAANVSHPDHLYSVKLPKLRPVYTYRVDISAAVADVAREGQESYFEFSTPASMPPVPAAQTLVSKLNPQPEAGLNGTMVRITLTPDMFDDSGGEILHYAIIVGRDIQHNNRIESGTRKSLFEWPIVNNWAESSSYDFILAYQVTPKFWNPFEGQTMHSNMSASFIIGEDMSCTISSNDFCNGPLNPDSTYSLRIRAFTEAGFQDSPPIKFSTGNETYSSARTNYWLVICVLVLLAFVVCGLYYVKNGQIPLIVEVRQRMNGKQRLTVSQTTNINIKKFAKYHARLQNTPQILRIEFNELNEISSKCNMSDNVGKRYDNYRKNRYLNIIPYDETRVKIQSRRGDYINASFIEGYKNMKNRYIACQGPLAETFTEFWSMVIQYDVTVIIMLCQILENKRVVCEKYFPDVNQTLKFDGIKVECTLFTSTSLYEERKIIVTKDTKEVTVSHIRFLEWPDFHVPSGPEILVDFCSAVRERFTKSPVIVHCSAGVGRTGTFIACDILLQHLPNNDSVNIFNTVLKLRKQRPHMVQSVAQYIYLYDCIFYAINKLNSKR